MCKIHMSSYRLNTAPITATVAKRFLYGERKKWPVHVTLQYWHTIATFSLDTKYYVRTHLKVTSSVLNTKGLKSQVLNRTEIEIAP